MRLQITERGKQVVASPAFIQHIKALLKTRAPQLLRASVAFVQIAWALTGGDVEAPPITDQDKTDFTIFLLNNKKAIREMSDQLSATIFREEFGPVN